MIKLLTTCALMLCLFQFAGAQQQPDNGGFENWTTGLTKVPVSWGSNDQLFGGEANRFVFKDSLPQNVSSGNYSVKLFSDTLTYMGVDLAPGVIGYGSIYILLVFQSKFRTPLPTPLTGTTHLRDGILPT